MDEAALIQTIMKAYRKNTCRKNQFACVQPLQVIWNRPPLKHARYVTTFLWTWLRNYPMAELLPTLIHV